MTAFLKKNWFWVSVIILILIKQRLVTLLPLFPIYSGGGYDDLLMVKIADKLLSGAWLTSPVMLTKGNRFPGFSDSWDRGRVELSRIDDAVPFDILAADGVCCPAAAPAEMEDADLFCHSAFFACDLFY